MERNDETSGIRNETNFTLSYTPHLGSEVLAHRGSIFHVGVNAHDWPFAKSICILLLARELTFV